MTSAPEPQGPLRVWYVTTGEAGTREQARGLAMAVSAQAEERVVKVNRFWALTALLNLGPPAVTAIAGRLEPPWPDILITCGRRSALVAMAIRHRNRSPMVMVHVQPPTYPKAFDLVVVLIHDRLHGANVMCVDTALHGVRPNVLAVAAARGDPRFAGLPRPWIGVLLGGSTRRRRFRGEDAEHLADQLDALRGRSGGSLVITPSRRTPVAIVAALSARYLSDRTVWIWDGRPPNPYLPILALADRLVVTSDSVSMISEALATTAPISIFGVAGSHRHARFLDNLIAKGLVAPLGGAPPRAGRPALDATPRVAARVRCLSSRKLNPSAADAPRQSQCSASPLREERKGARRAGPQA